MILTGWIKILTDWKILNIFEILNTAFSKFYNPSKNLTVDEVTAVCMGSVLFKQDIPKKYKCFGIKNSQTL
jgi:hypothetical protein